MIQSILFFVLGFLCAAFLALMVAPPLWRRAVRLTRKRIEASVPLSMSEIQADKDRMRAEFAMSTRRLEMSIKSFREKAAAQVVEINRNREELRRIATERAERDEALSQLEARGSDLRSDIRKRESEMERLGKKLEEADRLLEERTREMERLGRMYDEAALTSSNRQIELVARETEVDKLAADMTALRNQNRDLEKRLNTMAAENRAAIETLKNEKKRTAEQDKKVERLMATIADREDKLDRRERELARLREEAKGLAAAGNTDTVHLAELELEKARLEAENAELMLRMSKLLAGATGGDVEKTVAKLSDDRDRLEQKLAIANRENKKLRAEMSGQQRAKSDEWSDERRENALLREQINDLAAEVISMTAALEGADSPIRKALAAAPGIDAAPAESAAPASAADPRDKITSLADRVKALQKAASAG